MQTSSSIGAAAGTQMSISGVIENPSPAPIPPASVIPANVTKADSGTVVLTNANTYTGNNYITGGVLNIQNPQALGVNTSTQETVTASGTLGTFTLFLHGYPAAVNSGPLPFNVNAASLAFALNNMLHNPSSPGARSWHGVRGDREFRQHLCRRLWRRSLEGAGGARSSSLRPRTSPATPSLRPVPLLLAGAVSGTDVASGATLQLQSGTETSGKVLTLNGAGFNNAGALENVSGINTWGTTPIVLASPAAIGVEAGTLHISMPITDSYQVQTVQFTGFVAGNAYTLSFNGVTTAALSFNATSAANAAIMQAALLSLPTISLLGGSVTVTPLAGNTYQIAFGAAMAGLGWEAITATRLTGPGILTAGVPTNASYGYGATKVGPGTLVFEGGARNTYTGLTDVLDGDLQLNKTGGATAVAGNLAIGDTLSQPTQTLTLSGYSSVAGDQFTLDLPSDADGGDHLQRRRRHRCRRHPVGPERDPPRGRRGHRHADGDDADQYLVAFGGGLSGTSPAAITYANVSAAAGSIAGVATPGVPAIPDSDIVQLLGSNQIAASTAVVTLLDDGLLSIARQRPGRRLEGSTRLLGTSPLRRAATWP